MELGLNMAECCQMSLNMLEEIVLTMPGQQYDSGGYQDQFQTFFFFFFYKKILKA